MRCRQSVLLALLIPFLLNCHFVQSIQLSKIMGQAISSTQFYLYGRKHFTATGYLNHVKAYTEPVQTVASLRQGEEGADKVDLTGKVVVVTGANSGLGREVATYAAAKGAKLFMLCRSPERAEKAKEEIAELTGSKDIEVVIVDVAELEQVRNAAKTVQSKTDKVDCLVCNAGVLLKEKQVSSDGYEATFASHLLGGAYLLPQLLLPQLTAAGKDSRCIFVTSGGMYNFKFPSWDVATSQTGKFDGKTAYSYAKRGQVLLAERWTRDLPQVAWVSAHPGWSDTPAVTEWLGDQKKYLEPLRNPWQGAEGVTWLVGTDRSKLQSGELYLDRKTQPKYLGGPFFTEGSYTKNKPEEVDAMMENLKKAAGL